MSGSSSRARPPPLSPANSPRKLHWKTVHPVPSAVEQRVKTLLLKRGEYGDLVGPARTQLEEYIEDEQLQITCEQALSLRHLLLQEKSTTRHWLLQRQRAVLLSKYQRGDSVCDLAKKFDFAPMAVVRAILTERDRISAKQLKAMLKHPQQHNGKLSSRDITQIVEASQNDIVAAVNQEQSAAQAEMFEDFLCSYLSRHGIKFLRQKDVAAQQMEKLGKVVATPDILFAEPMNINGVWTNWIDAKNFYGADTPGLRKRAAKQTDRYVQRWGAGSLVFSKGHCSSLRIPGCGLLGAPVVGPIMVPLPMLHPGSPTHENEGAAQTGPTKREEPEQGLASSGAGLQGRVVCIRWPLEDGTWKWCTGRIKLIRKSNACRRGSWYKYGIHFHDDAEGKLMWTRLHHLQYEVMDSGSDSDCSGKENDVGRSSDSCPSRKKRKIGK